MAPADDQELGGVAVFHVGRCDLFRLPPQSHPISSTRNTLVADFWIVCAPVDADADLVGDCLGLGNGPTCGFNLAIGRENG